MLDVYQEILDESGYNDLTTNTDNVINCAILLVLGYIREATTYALSCGGGSSPGYRLCHVKHKNIKKELEKYSLLFLQLFFFSYSLIGDDQLSTLLVDTIFLNDDVNSWCQS